jgi:adenosine deaminase
MLNATTVAVKRIATCCTLIVLFAVGSTAFAAEARPAGGEARAEHALEQARKQGPLALRAFLVKMPKGADLHNHLAGAVYAESWIRAAGEDGLCVDTATLSFLKAKSGCGEGKVDAAKVPDDQRLYDALVDAFSMRSFVPSAGVSGHDQFFVTFDRFHGTSHSHMGEWLDEVAARATAQNEQYLELMETPEFSHAAALAEALDWPASMPSDTAAFFAKTRDELLAKGLRDEVEVDRKQIADGEAKRAEIEKCGTAQAAPACSMEIRFIYQILRGLPPQVVFAQTLLGFETASADPDFVGLNFVMPEDGYISMRDYALQMRMLDYLHSIYPKVHITLHAGELAPGLVPPDGLKFHIRMAVEQGHAERIGHGVDVMYEDRPYELLKELAKRRVMVEINLTSNDVILGVKGADHPLPLYRRYGVPVALSTDDEGVSRIDMTNEYVRAVETYNLSYAELKQMVRTGLEHDFLPGASLWQQTGVLENFRTPIAACRSQIGTKEPSGSCADLLKTSEKARQQWELERRFREFESGVE